MPPRVLSRRPAAEEYAAALNDAYRVGITDAMPFYAVDARVDKRFINYEGIGRARFAQALRDNAQNPPTWTGGRDDSDLIDFVATEPLYLPATGSSSHFTGLILRLSRPSTRRSSPPWSAAASPTRSSSGPRNPACGLPRGPRRKPSEFAKEYLAGLASGGRGAIQGQYADDATLTDSLAGREVYGASAIAEEARATAGLSLRATLHGPASRCRANRLHDGLSAPASAHRSTRPASGRAREGDCPGAVPSHCGSTPISTSPVRSGCPASTRALAARHRRAPEQ